jgi:hypothetical protein
MYRDRYSRPWQIGERAWTKQERAFGRSYSPTSNAKRSAQHPSPPDPPTSRASASSRHVLRANNVNLGAALGSNERFNNNSSSRRAIDDVSSTSSSSNSVSSVESNIKFKAQNARLKEGRPKHRSNNVADSNSTNRISNKANQNEDRSAAQDTLVVGKQRRAKESPYAFEKDPTHARSDSYRSNDDNFAQQNAETTFNSRQNDPNSSFLNRTQSSSVLFMAPGFHHPTKNTCTAFPRLCSASATQKWMSKYRFYRAGLGHNSVGLQHPMAFIQQKEQSWLSDMWNESRSQLNIAHSWSSATLYDDEEFFDLLLKVIVTHVGDDRLIFSSKCSVQCGFDENNQAAVEEYFSDLKAFFDSNNTSTATRCKLLIAGFEDNFPTIHEFLVGNQDEHELNNIELTEALVRSWIWNRVRIGRDSLMAYPSAQKRLKSTSISEKRPVSGKSSIPTRENAYKPMRSHRSKFASPSSFTSPQKRKSSEISKKDTPSSNGVTCYNCRRKGHVAKDCPDITQTPRQGNSNFKSEQPNTSANKYGPAQARHSSSSNRDKRHEPRRRLNVLLGNSFDTMQAKLNDILTVDVLFDSGCNECSVIHRYALDFWRDRPPVIDYEHSCGSLADGSPWISDSYIIVDVVIPCMSLNLRHKSFRTKLRIVNNLNVDVIIGLPDIVRCNLFDVFNKNMRRSYDH